METLYQQIRQRDNYIKQLLDTLAARHKLETVFLFGGEADPFWVSRFEISDRELDLFRRALSEIEEMENRAEKPFFGFDAYGQYSFVALSEETDLYIVILVGGSPDDDRPAHEARMPAPGSEALLAIGNELVADIRAHLAASSRL